MTESTTTANGSRNLGGTRRRTVVKMTAGALVGAGILSRMPARSAQAQAATPAAGSDTCPVTTEAENIELVRRYIEEGVRAGGEAVVRELLANDEIHHWGVFDTSVGIDAYLERLERLVTAFPDYANRAEQAIADGNMVALRYTATGTHQGTWLGFLEPTGTRVEYTGMNMYRIECGKIAESWGEANHLSVLRQLGGIPDVVPPEATPAD